MPAELETPVQMPDLVPLDNRPGYTRPDTSHLDGVNLNQSPEADEAEEAKDLAAGIKLPRTLRDSLDMLSDVQGKQPVDRAEAKLKEVWAERLRAHIHALSQGPACKPISVVAHKDLAGTSSEHADDIHLTLLCRSDRVVADRLARMGKAISDQAAVISDLRRQLAARAA